MLSPRKLRWQAASRSELDAQETGYRFVLSFDVVQPRSLKESRIRGGVMA